MQQIPEGFDIEEGLQQLNTTARKIGNFLKGFAKFLVAVFVYLLLNVCVMLMFDYVKPASMEFVRLLDNGLRVFMSQNLTIILSFFAQYKFVAFSIAVVATAISCVVKFPDKSTPTPFFASKEKHNKTFAQYAVSRVCVFSYKQHVAFLA